MSSLTGATAAYALSVPGVFNTPQFLQGFATDDVFSTPGIKSVETLMGVDGKMSAGFVYVEITQSISIQSDSDSAVLFDDWYAAQQAAQDVYFADATIILRALGQKWAMTRGVLSNYMPIPDVKKLIQPRKFEITWNFVEAAPT